MWFCYWILLLHDQKLPSISFNIILQLKTYYQMLKQKN